MKLILIAAMVFIAMALSACFSDSPQNRSSQYRGAPAPVIGAGLPLVLVVAGGYWIVRRLRR